MTYFVDRIFAASFPTLQSKASWPKEPGVAEMCKFSKQVHWAWRELLVLSYCGSWTHVFYLLDIQHHIIVIDLGHTLFLGGWFPILLESSLQGCSSKGCLSFWVCWQRPSFSVQLPFPTNSSLKTQRSPMLTGGTLTGSPWAVQGSVLMLGSRLLFRTEYPRLCTWTVMWPESFLTARLLVSAGITIPTPTQQETEGKANVKADGGDRVEKDSVTGRGR